MDDIVTYQHEPPADYPYREWIACYRDEEPDEFDGLAFGYGSTELRAISDLMIRFPREA
jgi:hypothetical protein